MSENRCIVESVMIDCLCEDEPRIAKVITDTDENYSYEDLYEVAELLNEQQATISALKEEIKQYWKCRDKWKQEAKELKEENEELRLFINKGKRLSVKELIGVINDILNENIDKQNTIEELKQKLKTKYIVNKQYEELKQLKQDKQHTEDYCAEIENDLLQCRERIKILEQQLDSIPKNIKEVWLE